MATSAEDLWPMVMQLSPEERARLVRMVLAGATAADDLRDAERYRAAPVGDDELAGDQADLLAWEADGWDEVS